MTQTDHTSALDAPAPTPLSDPPAPAPAPAPHRHQVHVRWSDQDILGHVNNAKYVQYLQEAMSSWHLERPDVGVLVAKTVSVEYRELMIYETGRETYVDAWVAEIGNRSVRLIFHVRDERALYAVAEAVFVAVDPATAGSRPLTPVERAHLSRHLIARPE